MSLSILTAVCLHLLTDKLKNECEVIPSSNAAALTIGAHITVRIVYGLDSGSEL